MIAGKGAYHCRGRSAPARIFSARKITGVVIASFLTALALFAIEGCRSRQEVHAGQVAEQVRTEFLHAWNNYERYAWGHDALRPLSKAPHDWYGQSLQMTPVDALDTLILMKLDPDAAKAQALIVQELSFDRDIY